jgi:hypothetical protein
VDLPVAFLFSRRFGFQHNLLAGTGNVDGQSFASQIPGQLIGLGYILFAGIFGKITGFA